MIKKKQQIHYLVSSSISVEEEAHTADLHENMETFFSIKKKKETHAANLLLHLHGGRGTQCRSPPMRPTEETSLWVFYGKVFSFFNLKTFWYFHSFMGTLVFYTSLRG
jgi:hypothetical protein